MGTFVHRLSLLSTSTWTIPCITVKARLLSVCNRCCSQGEPLLVHTTGIRPVRCITPPTPKTLLHALPGHIDAIDLCSFVGFASSAISLTEHNLVLPLSPSLWPGQNPYAHHRGRFCASLEGQEEACHPVLNRPEQAKADAWQGIGCDLAGQMERCGPFMQAAAGFDCRASLVFHPQQHATCQQSCEKTMYHARPKANMCMTLSTWQGSHFGTMVCQCSCRMDTGRQRGEW